MMKRNVVPLFLECDRFQTITCWAGIVAFVLLTFWNLVWLVSNRGDLGTVILALPAALLVGLFLADLFSGFVHWATDTWFDETGWTRIISIAREHHIHPHHIVGYGFRDYVAYSAWPALLVLGPVGLVLTLLAAPGSMTFLEVFTLFVVSICMIFGTYAHRLGHQNTRSPIVRLAQRCHLLISPRYHRVHHSDNHDIRYCVINGWANGVCDAIGFWRGMEWAVHHLTGAIPRKNDHEWFARHDPQAPRRGRFPITAESMTNERPLRCDLNARSEAPKQLAAGGSHALS
jgi:plasmanylethanolamine desaturase